MPFKCLITIFLLLFGQSFLRAQAQQEANYHVIPLPLQIEMKQGNGFQLNASTVITCQSLDEAMQRNATFLTQYIQEATGWRPKVVTKRQKNAIVLSLNKKLVTEEGYTIDVKPNSVDIASRTACGIFRAIQTLRKSLPQAVAHQPVLLKPVHIADAPRFAYRGMMLDCARHFFPAEFIKKVIDIMALHQMNTFHWHLTDDQGWRIEMKRYPELTQKGSQRAQTMIGFDAPVYDGQPYGGYYTEEQIADIVEYARQRYINVVPEVDMPGHTSALLAAYPSMGCTGGPYEVACDWGVHPDILCVGNDSTRLLTQGIMDELMRLFPSSYIHLGGDEAPKQRWRRCPKCKALVGKLGIKASTKRTSWAQLQDAFTNQLANYLSAHGRRLMVWDEAAAGEELPQQAVVLNWRAPSVGFDAARRGHDVVVASHDYLYFDYGQDSTTHWGQPALIGQGLTLQKVYGFEPAPNTLPDSVSRHIIGVQANLWTEYVCWPNLVEYQLLPRLAALAETQWTDPRKKDWSDFSARLPQLERLYDKYRWIHARR